MAPRARARLLTGLLALGSFAFTLLLLELGARLLRRSGIAAGETERVEVYTEYDPLLGWRKRPGARATRRRREYTVEVAVNSLGLRDPERGHETPPGTVRLLALGDSFVEGYTVPLEGTVTQQLERGLRATGCPAEVINGGSAGWSTDQEYLFFKEEGHRYSPRLVLLFFYYNDVVYNDRQFYNARPKPILVLRDGELRLHRYPVRETAPAAPRAEAAEQSAAPGGSALAELVKERLWYGAPDVHDALAGLGLWDPIPKVSARMELRVYERRAIPEIEDAWQKTAAIIGALAGEAARHSSRLLLVYAPSRLEIQERAWQLSQRLYGMEPGAWDRRRVGDRLASIAAERQLPLLDLSEPLRAVEQGAGGSPYLSYDVHWNALGHAAAARAIDGRLRELGWLAPDCASPR